MDGHSRTFMRGGGGFIELSLCGPRGPCIF